MPRIRIACLVVSSLVSVPLAQQSPADRCLVFGPDPSARVAPTLAGQADCSATSTTVLPQYEPGNGIVLQVPVVFHVISSSTGQGNLGRARLESQIDVLNQDFNALPGSLGQNGHEARIWFYLATEDPDGNPTNGIDRVTNDDWFSNRCPAFCPGPSNFFVLAWDPNRYLNIYTKDLGVLGVNGGAAMPQLGPVGDPMDGVALDFRRVGLASPQVVGRVGTHEVGHWLGLFHTFQGGCVGDPCYQTGDLVCDTNPHARATAGCPTGQTTTCNPSLPEPIDNYMNTSAERCMERFTPEQVNRLRCTLENWRPDLHRPLCATASSRTYRNAPPNPDVYTATTARLAHTQLFQVDTRPYSFAVVLGRSLPANVTLAGGQVLLIDLDSAPMCSSGPLVGPDATFERRVPFESALCGLTISSQAVLFGGRAPFALTNAIDFVIGG